MAADAVISREHTLLQLQQFEEESSDPRRMAKATASIRLKEERTRAMLYNTVCTYANTCETIAKKLKKEFNVDLKYEGMNFVTIHF